MIPYPYAGYEAPGMPFFEQAYCEYPTKKYRECLNRDNKIFEKSYISKIPKPLKYCEELFNANVLVIKKLVKDIGDLTPIVHKERKKIFYVMIVVSLHTHFFQKLIKKFSLTD